MSYRLSFLAAFLALCAAGGAPGTETRPPIRLGTTAVILQDQARFISDWGRYLQSRLNRPVQFIERGSYAEVSELLSKGDLDIAWVCGAPYVRNPSWRLVAVPVFRGQPLYQSYLIVRSGDNRTRSYGDLDNAVFAFSDPDSNSGYLVPQFEMLKRGLRSRTYLRKTFFTWAHQDTVRAVAIGLAQAGAVDGYIWETLREIDPELTAKTRVVAKSDWYGFPPIVANASLAGEQLERIRTVLIGMNKTPEGRALLERMNLDAFVSGSDELFDGIREINRFVDAHYAQAQGPQL